MKNLKLLLCLLVVVAASVFVFTACGEPEDTTAAQTTTAATTTTTAAPTAPTPGEGQVLYSVKVVDAAGAPVNAYVQLCLETCGPEGEIKIWRSPSVRWIRWRVWIWNKGN